MYLIMRIKSNGYIYSLSSHFDRGNWSGLGVSTGPYSYAEYLSGVSNVRVSCALCCCLFNFCFPFAVLWLCL